MAELSKEITLNNHVIKIFTIDQCGAHSVYAQIKIGDAWVNLSTNFNYNIAENIVTISDSDKRVKTLFPKREVGKGQTRWINEAFVTDIELEALNYEMSRLKWDSGDYFGTPPEGIKKPTLIMTFDDASNDYPQLVIDANGNATRTNAH